jgi:presenilin-like A22 family membrane protease
MKLIKKHVGAFLLIVLLGMFIGTLAWDIVERIFAQAGLPFSLETGPIGFDIGVLSVYLKINPGSFLGAAGGILLFRSL